MFWWIRRRTSGRSFSSRRPRMGALEPARRPPHIGCMTKLSFLDLVPVTDTGTISQSLANAADLARHAEALGYERYWVAEHHGMTGIASAATAVVLAHVGRSEEHTAALQSLMRT